MKSTIIVTVTVAGLFAVAFLLLSIATDSQSKPIDLGPARSSDAPLTPFATPVAGVSTPVTGATPTATVAVRVPTLTPKKLTYYPATRADLRLGQSIRYLLADGTSRTVTLRGTELVFAHQGVTVWSTATVEVSGAGLEAVVEAIPAAYLRAPTIMHGVRVYVDVTREYNDRQLRDGGGTSADARLILSDAALPLTDLTQFRWPFPTLLWGEGSRYSWQQSLQGGLDSTYHHGAIDIGMPRGTPVHAYSDGTLQVQDRGFDFVVRIENPSLALPAPLQLLHLEEAEVQLNEGPVKAGDYLGRSGRANWYHTDLRFGYEWGPILAEWYLAHATPAQLSFVKEWLVVGPYEDPDEATRLSKDYLGNEVTVAPREGEEASQGRTWDYWDNLVPGIVSVADAVDRYPNSGWAQVNGNYPAGAAYMATYVNTPTPVSVVLNISASDMVRVWLNGSLVAETDGCVPGDLEGEVPTIVVDDLKVPVELIAGWNTVMVKSAQKARQDGRPCHPAWQFGLRISDSAGEPVPGLRWDPLRRTAGAE